LSPLRTQAATALATEQGRLDEAEALARQALALDRQMFTPPHAFIAESLRRVGSILRLKGDFEMSWSTSSHGLGRTGSRKLRHTSAWD
jgi:Tetratricopeptide repeat